MSSFERIQIEPEVVAALKRGDRAAAETIYRALSTAVYTLARRLMVDTQQAKEVTQDTFIDVIERAGSIASPDAFVGWVRTVAVNHCLMRLRSPWYRRRSSTLPDPAEDAALDAGRLEGLEDVERALARLSPETRFVVWMHDVEGHTHAEIGRLVGRTASYSKSQLARAYAELLAWSSLAPRKSDKTEVRDVETTGRTLVEGQDDASPPDGAAHFARTR
jgi:RNA polymerase sigma-70 factor (ECF subfamily)